MQTGPHPPDHTLLSHAWRRRFVLLLTGSAAGLLVVRSVEPLSPQLRHGGTVLFLTLAIVALWFLADALRPWLRDDDEGDLRIRTEAGSRAHGTMIWMAAAAWAYLWAAAARPQLLPAVRLDLSELLVMATLVALILPLTIVAWRQPDGAATIGPVRLVRDRFSGEGSGVHLVAAGMMALAACLLALAAAPDRLDGPLGRAVLLAALAILVAAVVGTARLLLLHSRAGAGDGRR